MNRYCIGYEGKLKYLFCKQKAYAFYSLRSEVNYNEE
jgi:hypothetical protein